MHKKVALITGITGQDGAYLTEFLLNKGYVVHGIRRRTSLFNTARIDHLYKDFHDPEACLFLHYGDMTDSSSLVRIIQQVRPDEIYNLSAQSHVAVSFEEPEYTANSDALGALRVLEAIRILSLEKETRFYQASSSELYGLVQETPQKETTPRSIRAPLMRWPSSTLTGSRSIIARPTAFMPAMASCSITKVRFAAKISSRARSPGPWHASSSGCRIAFISAISTRSETGDMLGTTLRCNGSCCSKTKPRISSSLPGCNTACATF